VNDPLFAGVRIAVAGREGVHNGRVRVVPDEADARVAEEEASAGMVAAERLGERVDNVVWAESLRRPR